MTTNAFEVFLWSELKKEFSIEDRVKILNAWHRAEKLCGRVSEDASDENDNRGNNV